MKGINEKKRIMINIVACFLSFAVSMGINFFLTPFIVSHVGKEAYGFVNLANNFVSYASIVVIALNSMAARYITISVCREEYDDASRYFSSVFLSNIILTIALSISAFFIVVFLDKIVNIPMSILKDVRILWIFIFCNSLIGIVASIFGCATFVRNRLEISSLRDILSNGLKAILLFMLFLIFKPKIYYIGISMLICTVFVTIVNVVCTKKLLPQVQIKRSFFEFDKVKELVMSGIWNSIGRISSILTDGLDLLIVNLFIGATEMGSLSVAKCVPTMILSIFGVLSSAFAPQFNISYAKNDMENIKNQLLSSIKIMGFLSCIPLVCLYAYGDIFFGLWVPKENAVLLQALAIASAAEFPIVLPLEPIWNVFTATNKIKYSTLFLISNSLVGIVITFALLKITNNVVSQMFIIAGISSLIAIIRGLTFMPIYTAKCINTKISTFYMPILKNVFMVVVLTLIAVVIRMFIKIDSWFSLSAVCIFVAVISIFINGFILLSKDERVKIISKIGRKK